MPTPETERRISAMVRREVSHQLRPHYIIMMLAGGVAMVAAAHTYYRSHQLRKALEADAKEIRALEEMMAAGRA
ncbi:hypothetical protein ACP70R_043234 [Stipagrostis hirtigluma subsp. patula]